MSRFLELMAERSRERVEVAEAARPLQELRETVLTGMPPRQLDGFGDHFDLIAEVKPRSPSEGPFPERDPAATAAAYASAGAAVISVLTEPSQFGGSLANLAAVSRIVSVPVMAKDFIVHPYQVFEARMSGADGVLVIARILDDETMNAMFDTVREIGMFALAEAFDAPDLTRISAHIEGRNDVLVGVNCRDLDTLEVVPERHRLIAPHLPPGNVPVAESAIASPADVEEVVALGYRAALVGSALMRANEPGELVGAMVAAGRKAVAVP